MNRQPPSRWALSTAQWMRACAMVCASLLFVVSGAQGQDAAEAARQEKARKAAQPQKPPPHVYTNDDLQRPKILTPEDLAPVEARKRISTPPASNQTSPSNSTTENAAASESLGEIARRLRQEKAERLAEQASKLSPPSLFHMELPQPPTLAHTAPLSAPRPLIAPSPSPRKVVPSTDTGIAKRDPFSRAMLSPVPPDSFSAPALKPRVPNSTLSKTPQLKSPSLKPVVPPALLLVPSSPRMVLPRVAAPRLAPPNASLGSSTAAPKSHPSTVQVQRGDSLWNLSRQYLGKSSRWQEWLSSNPQIGDPRRMQTGAILFVPTDGARPEPRSEGQTPGTVSVQPGDSLWRIAAKHLGNGATWPCMAQANPDLPDVARIYPGQTLQLPAACAATMSPSVGAAATKPATN